jgi:DNA-binding transcriptional regulator GbsR (MarR family)
VSARQSETPVPGTAASGEVHPPRTAVTSGEVHPPETAATSGNGIRPASGERTAPAGDNRDSALSGAGRDPVAVRAFIERFTAQLTQAGFPRTPARIFVALLTSDSSRLTAAELAELLQASPASISGGVRYLIQVGLVAAEGEPGSRRQHYWMSEDVWQDIVRLRDRQFTRWAAELQDGVRILGADSPAGTRMANTVRYFEFISSEMAGLLARWDSRDQAADSG